VAWHRHVDPQRIADDPRFATAIYRVAISGGVMGRVVFQQPGVAA
jgi:hypothetical protein